MSAKATKTRSVKKSTKAKAKTVLPPEELDPIEAEIARVEKEIFGKLPPELNEAIEDLKAKRTNKIRSAVKVIPYELKRAEDRLNHLKKELAKYADAIEEDPAQAKAYAQKVEHERLIEKQKLIILRIVQKWQKITLGFID